MLQSNNPSWGGARIGGSCARAVSGAFLSRWASIFSMTSGSSIHATIRTTPQQDGPPLYINAEYPFQALPPGHRRAPLGWRRLLCRGLRFAPPAPLPRNHPRAVATVWSKRPVEACQVRSRRRHQGCQLGDKVQRLKDDMRRTISIRRLQLISHIAIRGERQI